MVIILLITFFPTQRTPIDERKQKPSTSPASGLQNPTIPTNEDIQGENNEESLENRPGLQKTENLTNGTTMLSYASHLEGRPNIIITKGDDRDNIVFQRTVTAPDFPVKITDYISIYGHAPKVYNNSRFYGPIVETHIYSDLGVAFIANPKTGDVLESQFFEPISIDGYLKNFGDDISTQP